MSSEKDARQRARQPWQDQRDQAALALGALPEFIVIGDVTPLLSEDFRSGVNVIEQSARQAMIQAIQSRNGSVRLRLHRGDIQMMLYLGGSWLQLRDGRIPFDAFFEATSWELLTIQKVYYDAMLQHGHVELEEYVDEHPWLVKDLLEDRIAKQRQAAVAAVLAEEDNSTEAAELRGIVSDQRARAENVRTTVVAVVAPLAVVASFFAIEGAADVFLSLFPAGKATELIKGLTKRGKATLKLSKTRKAQLAQAMGANETHFVRLAGRLGQTELRALETIIQKVRTPEVVNLLLTQRVRGQADLEWIAKKLDDGTFHSEFIGHFTRYDANPTWNQLRGLIDNSLEPASRDSVASKLVGFLGEEAAARHVQSEMFTRRFFKRGEPTAVTRGHRTLDLTVTGDKGRMLFGETKNLSAENWSNPSKQGEVLEQLAKHNKTINDIAKAAENREVVGKVLFVTERGFTTLELQLQEKLKKEIARLGWVIEVIPGEHLESMGQFLDRMRKGES